MPRPPSERPYVYAWGNNERRRELQGRLCRVITRGEKGTVLVELIDTKERVTCSFRALRRAGDAPQARGGTGDDLQ